MITITIFALKCFGTIKIGKVAIQKVHPLVIKHPLDGKICAFYSLRFPTIEIDGLSI